MKAAQIDKGRASKLDVELHCHTCYSNDSLMLPPRLLEVAARKGIDRIAITDHNTIAGALRAKDLDPERVIVGEEIRTTKGELLGYFLREEIPAGLSPQETIERLRDQDAVISVSHPFDPTRGGAWSREDLDAILPLVDAIEVFNARTVSARPNQEASRLALARSIPGTAGSDAHAYSEIGQVVVRMPAYRGAAGFLESLSASEIIGERSSPLVHFYTSYAKLRKRLGWRPPGAAP